MDINWNSPYLKSSLPKSWNYTSLSFQCLYLLSSAVGQGGLKPDQANPGLAKFSIGIFELHSWWYFYVVPSENLQCFLHHSLFDDKIGSFSKTWLSPLPPYNNCSSDSTLYGWMWEGKNHPMDKDALMGCVWGAKAPPPPLTVPELTTVCLCGWSVE